MDYLYEESAVRRLNLDRLYHQETHFIIQADLCKCI